MLGHKIVVMYFCKSLQGMYLLSVKGSITDMIVKFIDTTFANSKLYLHSPSTDI